MATAVAATSGTSVHDRFIQIFGADGFLNEHNVERKIEVELLALAILAQTDLLFLGEPGVGKTYLLEMFTEHCLADAKLYDHMLFKESGLDEVVGPRSVQGMKADEVRRIVEGFLPEAHTAIIDEIFKGSASVLNAMLGIFANRTLKVGGKPIKCDQLMTILMASNELPTSEDLMPFRDRIGITKVVEPIQTSEGRKRVRHIQLGQMQQGVHANFPPLTLDEIAGARAEVEAVELPEPVGLALDKAQEEWLDAKHAPSQRRMKQVYKVVKAHAWLRGASVATSDDLIPAQHMAWNHQEDADSARKIIMKHAGQFTRKVNSLKTKLDPKLHAMDAARTAHKEAQDEDARKEAFNKVYDANRELADFEDEAQKLRDSGLKSGQDPTELDELIALVGKARGFAKRVLMGEEEDE